MADVNAFNLLDESENKLINVVDSKAEELYLAEVKKKKKQKLNKQGEAKGQEKKKQSQSYEQTKPIRAKRLVLPYSFRKSEIVLRKEKVVAANASAQSVPPTNGQDKGAVSSANGSVQSVPTTNGSQSLNGADSRPVCSTASTGSVGSGRYQQAPPGPANGGQYYGRGNGGNYYQGEERRINNGGQNYGRANEGGYNRRRNYRGASGGYQVRNQKQGGEEAKVDNGVVNGPDEEGWQTYHSRKRPDHHHNQRGYDQQPAQGDFVEGRQGRRRWSRKGSEAENNQGDNNGEDKDKVEKEKDAQVVVEKQEKQEQEGGDEEEGNKAEVESNGVDGSSNKKKTRNMNGSRRKKLKKKKEAAEANKSQGSEDNNAAAPDAPSTDVSSVHVVKEVTTLKEYEEKVVVPKKKDLQVVTKSSDGDFKRSTKTLAKEFESMQAIGKKKWGDEEEEEDKISVSKHRDKSAEVNVKKDPAILTKIKTQKMSINEFHGQKKVDSTAGQQPSQRDGKFGGYRRSQRARVNTPAPFKIEEAQFPPLG